MQCTIHQINIQIAVVVIIDESTPLTDTFRHKITAINARVMCKLQSHEFCHIGK